MGALRFCQHATLVLLLLASGGLEGSGETYKWDESGYILYCPCMGKLMSVLPHLLAFHTPNHQLGGGGKELKVLSN